LDVYEQSGRQADAEATAQNSAWSRLVTWFRNGD
jgi:hypothetical protein